MNNADPKSVVALNEPDEALEIFKQELMPAVKDVRGELVACDLGDYVHIVLNHAEMAIRVRWIVETLRNPEQIRRHRIFPNREVYINTVFESEDDEEGTMHIVVIQREVGRLKLWTSFIPRNPERYLNQLERGELLWQAES